MFSHSKCPVFIFFMLLYLPESSAKSHCKEYLNKLHNIQSLQRHGYSLKQGQSLKRREEKARKTWWQCENGKLKTKKTSAKKKVSKTKVNDSKQQQARLPLSPYNHQPFASTSVIVSKQKYSGEELKQWLSFYQQPKGCSKPQSMKKFTYCVEDKNKQQALFELQKDPNLLFEVAK